MIKNTLFRLGNMIRNDFKNYNYQGWKRYHGSCSIGNKEPIQIKGHGNNVMINLKQGSDSFNKIAIFIDIAEKIDFILWNNLWDVILKCWLQDFFCLRVCCRGQPGPERGELHRPDKGKWLTADPLGYPDGWNQLAYCGNKCTNSIDFCGKWTIQIGISLTGGGSVGATVGWGFAISYDAEGGFRSGFYSVGGGGAYVGAGGSLTLDVTISGNQTIEALRGTTMTVGTSLGAGIGVGTEINIPADFPGNASESLTFSVGASGGPLPFEQHTFVTQSIVYKVLQKQRGHGILVNRKISDFLICRT